MLLDPLQQGSGDDEQPEEESPRRGGEQETDQREQSAGQVDGYDPAASGTRDPVSDLY